MRCKPTVLTVFAVGSFWTGLSNAAHEINTTAAAELPDCVKQCGVTIPPKFNCLVGEDCWCEQTGSLADELSECVVSECPGLREALEGLKFQATICEYPMDRNLGSVTSGVAFTLFALATFFLLARFLSRWPYFKGAGIGWDDAIALACYIPVVGMTVAVSQEVKYGSGRDSWTLQIEDVVAYAKWFYIAIPLYILATFSTKLSLIALYLRVWPAGPTRTYSTFGHVCWIMVFVLLASAIACVLAMIFACNPISNAWKYANTGNGTCINRVGAAYVYGGLNIAYDLVVIALPIPKLLRLDVSRGQKIGVMACFLVGFVATGCSIIRLFTLNGLLTARNITWDFTPAGFWSIVEVYCSMICCCMPAMFGLINRCLRRVTHASFNNSRRTRLPSFAMAQPPNRRGTDSDLDDLDPKSKPSTPRLGRDIDDAWDSHPPLRRYTIKGGLVQQVTEDNKDVR